MKVRITDRELPYLDADVINAIFDCVYGVNDRLQERTKSLLNDERFKGFVELLLVHQNYNYWYRQGETIKLFPLFESTIGPMERNSNGTTFYLAMGLALKEIYGLKMSTLEKLLRLLN